MSAEDERFAGLHDKYATEAATPTVRDFHAAIRARFEQRFQESGLPWEEFVFNPDHALTLEDLTAVEAEMLAGGYRFDHSAQVSVTEEPEKYKAGAATSAEETPGERVETVPPASSWSSATATTSSPPTPTSRASPARSRPWSG